MYLRAHDYNMASRSVVSVSTRFLSSRRTFIASATARQPVPGSCSYNPEVGVPDDCKPQASWPVLTLVGLSIVGSIVFAEAGSGDAAEAGKAAEEKAR